MEIVEKRTQEWWNDWWMGMAKYVSTASKDVSTKVGAVITTPDNRFVSMGFNGLARQIPDNKENLENRERKLALILHGEENAFHFAKESTEGCHLYTWPFPPCAKCASIALQYGISKVFSPDFFPERWKESFMLGQEILGDRQIFV